VFWLAAKKSGVAYPAATKTHDAAQSILSEFSAHSHGEGSLVSASGPAARSPCLTAYEGTTQFPCLWKLSSKGYAEMTTTLPTRRWLLNLDEDACQP
jgi:hypothetical protein